MDRPAHTHQRTKSTFSFKSNKSDKSDPTRPKPNVKDLHETEEERHKARFAVQTVKDPNKAIRDAQPADRLEASTLPQLRATQYKDWKGELITDADASNPTRPRLERPLDTIKSFEAAIDNQYKRKSHMAPSEPADFTASSSRRNSYVAGTDTPNSYRRSTPVDGYRSNRNSHRYNDHYAHRPSNPRYHTSPMPPPSNAYNGFPQHGYSPSYDTVDTGASYGTSGSEPWANSTDPSSENSSIERMYGVNGHKPEYQDMYGGQYRRESPRHDAIQEEYGHDGYGYTQGQYNGPYSPQAPPRQAGQFNPGNHNPMAHSMGPPTHSVGPPPPPAHQPHRNVIPLGGAPVSNGPAPPRHNPPQQGSPIKQQNSNGEGKRKSWLKRRFSKGS